MVGAGVGMKGLTKTTAILGAIVTKGNAVVGGGEVLVDAEGGYRMSRWSGREEGESQLQRNGLDGRLIYIVCLAREEGLLGFRGNGPSVFYWRRWVACTTRQRPTMRYFLSSGEVPNVHTSTSRPSGTGG